MSECEAIDAEYNNSRMSIEEYKRRITEVFYRLDVIERPQERIDSYNLNEQINETRIAAEDSPKYISK